MDNFEKELNENRPTREKESIDFGLFEPHWKDMWWGMPEFVMKDASPQRRIVMNFMTEEDVKEFAEKLGIRINKRTDSAWYPGQKPLEKNKFEYTGPPEDSKYPVCIPSKGRADVQTTGKLLDQLGVSYKFFVEETEAEEYIKHLGKNKVVVMPFHDLGRGSVPARNYIWEWCKKRGFKRHWTVDDNITTFTRCNHNRRLKVTGGGFFRAMEDFVDRYENIVMAGPHDQGFVRDRSPNHPPYLFNSRIYSCILLKTDLPHRWRGRYNEDTDLSLRLLKDGYCTLLFYVLLMNKGKTFDGGKTKGALKGGNTDNVYNTNDYRKSFAKSLQKQHPDVVDIVFKFNRWHHQVDYSKFKRNKPILKPDITPIKSNDEYGMKLIKRK